MDNPILIAIISAAVGGIVSYLLANHNARIELDEETRKARVEDYKKLWALTGKLPRYPPAKNLTYQDLEALSENFRDWYFQVGGIYLSEKSRDVYFSVQEALLEYSQKTGTLNPLNDKGKYDKNSDYEFMRKKMSALRTQLAKDIGSRRMPGSAVLNDENLSTNSPSEWLE